MYWKKKPLLHLALCISLVGEILFLSGKSQGILKKDVCGKHENVNLCKTKLIFPQPILSRAFSYKLQLNKPG